MVYHKASLVAQRDFWRLLTREKIPLDRLGHSFSRMDEMESKAAATYKIVLDRYPSNAKLLRSYAKFLESIKVWGWVPASSDTAGHLWRATLPKVRAALPKVRSEHVCCNWHFLFVVL